MSNKFSIFACLISSFLVVRSFADAQAIEPKVTQKNGSEEYSAIHEMGLRAGFRASSEEVLIRKRILKDQDQPTLNDSAIARIIISDKFFVKSSPRLPTQEEVDAALLELKASLKNNIEFKDEELKDLAIVKACAKFIENQDQIRKSLNDFSQELISGKNVESQDRKTWTASELQLSYFENKCLAWNLTRNNCQATVSDFNKNALTLVLNREIGLDSARWLVMDKTLNMGYYLQKAEEAGVDKNSEFKKVLEGKLKSYSIRDNQGIVDSAVLKKIYAENFQSMFSEREVVKYKLIGSSSKKWIDSIHALLKRPPLDSNRNPKTAVRRRLRPVNAILEYLPWRNIAEEELPTQLANKCDTLGPKMFSEPISTPYGYFLVLVEDVRMRSLVSFEEAREQLYLLARSGKVSLGKRSVSELDAKKWYAANAKSLPREDTLTGRLWLFPQSDNHASFKLVDTTKTEFIRCSISEMPNNLRKVILHAAAGKKPNDLVGPLLSDFGRIVFQIENRKESKSIPTFEQAKPEIIKMLSLRPYSIGDVQIDERTEFIRNDLLAMSGFNMAIQSARLPTEVEMQLAEKTMSVEVPPHASPQMKTELIRYMLRERFWRTELNEWKDRNLEIDWSALRN